MNNTRITKASIRFALFLLAVGCIAPITVAAPPELYSQPFHQSPVRGEPDDLLMIPGHGFADGAIVVYRRLIDTTLPLLPPSVVPSVSTADEGVTDVVSCRSERLVVRLPSVMTGGQSYGLWVRNPGEAWSEGIRINDARPLWLTPEVAFETAALATLPRELKVVGRNLQPAPTTPTGTTRVRLSGPAVYELDSLGEVNPALEHYVARVSLPIPLAPGEYTVEVSRDGVSWVALPGQTLSVQADPLPPSIFHIAGFGTPEDPCLPDDGVDDALCIQTALNAIGDTPGGGTLLFGTGRWDLRNVPDSSYPGRAHGIVVPVGVSIRGQALGTTEIVRTEDWGWVPGICEEPDPPCVYAVFTLLGRTSVTDLHLNDEFPDNDFRNLFFQLGKWPWLAAPEDPEIIEEISFTGNVMKNMYYAIGDTGYPLHHVYIVNNHLEAYHDNIVLGGNRFIRDYLFDIRESVIAYNDFYPGQYYDPEIVQGVIATQLGASRRLDFSHNTSHPLDSAGQCSTLPTGCGWRATHFWHMNNNHEMMLVSRNYAQCTGDKAGDGEFIVWDNNANEPGFQSARDVLDATTSTVSVNGPWFIVGSEGTGDLNYYGEHWVQVADGKGLGQVRKIESCCCGAECASPDASECGAPCASEIVIRVTPDWDVVPQPGNSQVTVLRQFWQTHIVDNEVDIRGCEKDNPTRPRSGTISFYANTADSAIESNRMHESDGIQLASVYSVDSHDPAANHNFSSWAMFQYFNEVRGNTVEGEFNFYDCSEEYCPRICCTQWCCPPDGTPCMEDDYCDSAACCLDTCCVPKNSWSGIELGHGQYPYSDSPVLGYGVSVSHNYVENADALRGGAIAIDRGWHDPPTPGHHQFTSVVIHHNEIRDLERRDALGDCLPYSHYDLDGGIGIHIPESLTHDTVLYANTIEDVCYPIEDHGTRTLLLEACPEETECSEGAGCAATANCFLSDTGNESCLLPDDTVFKCPMHHTVQVRRCTCTGPTCPLNDNHLVCIPDAGLPDCPAESECSTGAGCSATGTCFYPDQGFPACVRPDQTVFGCPEGESVHVRRCLCSGPTCPLNDNHLVCLPVPPATPAGPGSVLSSLQMGKSESAAEAITLTWAPSCLAGASDYGIYEGQIGDWESHEPVDCTDEGTDRTEEIVPAGGDTYYLLVPFNVDDDGSFGSDSVDGERFFPETSCRLSQNLEACP